MMGDFNEFLSQSHPDSPAPGGESGFDRWYSGADEKSQTDASVYAGSKIGPDSAATVLDLSGRTGVPADVVERNVPGVQEDARMADFAAADLSRRAPAVARWAGESPHNAALIGDDADAVAKVEEGVQDYGFMRGLLSSFYHRGIGETAASVGRLNAGLYALYSLPYNAIAAAAGKPQAEIPKGFLDNDVTRYWEDFSRRNTPKELDESVVSEYGKGNYKRAARILAFKTAANLPQQVTYVGAALTGNPALAAGALAYGGTVSGLQSLKEGQDSGATPFQNTTNAVLVGGIEALGENLGTFGIAEKIAAKYGQKAAQNLIIDTVKTMGWAALGEGNEEFWTQIGQDVSARLTGVDNRNISWKEFAAQSFKDAIEAGLLGGTSGGLMTAPGAMTAGYYQRQQAQSAAMAKDFYTALGDSVEATKAHSRLPAATREIVDRITKGSPVQDVFIPVDAIEKYSQGANVNATQLMESVGATESFKEAQSTGGHVKIPLSVWAEKVVGTDHYKALANDITFDPNELTVNQVKDLRKQVSAEAEKAKTGPAAPEAVIAEDVSKRLQAIGFERRIADSYAQVYGERYKTRAGILGVDPLTLFRRENVQFTRTDAGKEAPTAAPVPEEFQKAFTPSSLLSGEQVSMEAGAASYAAQNMEQILSDYEKAHGNEISTDKFRDYLRPIGYTGLNSSVFHEPAAALRRVYQQRVLEKALSEGKMDVVLMAGGSGAGKTSSLANLIPEKKSGMGAIIDANLSDFEKAKADINAMISRGMDPRVWYVYREPVESWVDGVIKRVTGGSDYRVVPLRDHLRLHKGSYETIQKLAAEFPDRVTIIDNSLGKGKRKQISVEELASKGYNDSEIRRSIINETIKLYEEGKIGAEIVRSAFAGALTSEETKSVDEVLRRGPLKEHQPAVAPKAKTPPDFSPKSSMVMFEVAPDPNNTALLARWRALHPSVRQRISSEVANSIVPGILDAAGVDGKLRPQIGGYLDDTNPSFALVLPDSVEASKVVELTKLAGFTLSQDSMMTVSEHPFAGAEPVWSVNISLPADAGFDDISKLYSQLREIKVDGEQPVSGHTTVDGQMVILNYSKVPIEELAKLIDEKTSKGYNIETDQVYAWFPGKEEYDYAGKAQQAGDTAPGQSSLQGDANRLRGEATRAVEEAIARYEGQPAPQAQGIITPQQVTAFNQGGQAPQVLFQPVSTRMPTAVKAKEDHLAEQLRIDLPSMKMDTEAFAQNVRAVTDYVNYKPSADARTPAARAERFIKMATENLLWLYDKVPAPVREKTKVWYDGANKLAEKWSTDFGISRPQASGVLAVLSPGTPWDTNVSQAERILDTYQSKQDFRWDDEMAKTAKRIFALPQFRTDIREIRGKTLAEVGDTYRQAMWVRIYDEAHNPRSFRSTLPTGGFGDFMRNQDGSESKIAWGPVPRIAKAIEIIKDGSVPNISKLLGEQHKVRNFYNNIVDPNSADGHVTIDTHAVAAALMRPLSQTSTEVIHNFGGAGSASSSIYGVNGTYGLYLEAYKRAAAARGVLPREMQSITLEAIRGLFSPAFKRSEIGDVKKGEVGKIDSIWKEHRKGEITAEEARNEIEKVAGGIRKPGWMGPGDGSPQDAGDSSYEGELPALRVSRRASQAMDAGAGERAPSAAEAGTEAGVRELALAQENRGQIRFGHNTVSIDLFEKANLSTVLHETGHLWMREMSRDAADLLSRAPETLTASQKQFLSDVDSVKEFLGADSIDGISVEQHEKWARAAEAYFMEGKSPSQALRGAFARFRAWLISIYKTIRSLDVNVPEHIRGVMDRLVAAQEEIDMAESEQNIKPLFADAKSIGMNDAQAASYVKAVAEARTAAEEELSSKLMGEVKREQSKSWVESRQSVQEEISLEINQRPEYIALSILQRGALPMGEGERAPEGLQAVKLSKDAIVKTYGEEWLAKLPKPYVYSVEGGIHPEQAAELFGFDSGEALLNALATATPKDQLIKTLVDQRMKVLHGDMMTDGTIAESAMQAVHNDKRAELLRKELEILASDSLPALKGAVRRFTRRAPTVDAIRNEARAAVALKSPRDIHPSLYQRAETSAAKEAIEAVLRGDFEAAFEAKRRELVNHELYRAASEAKEEIASIVDYLGKFAKDSVREKIGKAGGEYLDQIDAISERYDFRKGISLRVIDSKKSLLGWVQDQVKLGYDVQVPEKILNEARRQHYKDTPYEELLGVRDTVKTIEHLARLKNELLANERHRTLDEARGEIISTIMANHKTDVSKYPISPTVLDKVKEFRADFVASHTKIEFLLEHLDGGNPVGAAYQNIWKPFLDAKNKKSERMQSAMARLREIFSPYSRSERALWYYKRTFIPEIGEHLNKAAMISVALNWGNQYNREALMEGYKWRPEQVQAILDKLDQRDWQTVQAVWDYIDSYWPDVRDLEKRVNGLAPEKVQATTVETKFGPLRGGYYPISFDTRQSWRQRVLAEGEAAQDLFGGQWARAMTRHGHTVERTNTGGKPLYLDLSVLTQHVENVIHDLSYREAVIDVARLLENDELRQAIQGAAGNKSIDELQTWVRSIAGDRQKGHAAWLEGLMRRARGGATTVNLGLKVTSGLAQTLGYLNTVKEIGPKYAALGLKDVFRNGANLKKTWDFISEKSAEMRYRLSNYDRDVRDTMRKLNVAGTQPGALGVIDAYTNEARESFFFFIGFMDLATSVPTWLGAYQKALDGKVDGIGKADDTNAVLYADKVVRETQSAGDVMDLARIQRGNDYLKMFTMFYSQASLQFNQFAKAIGEYKISGDAPRMVASMALLWFLPAVLEELIRGRKPDDDEEWWKWVTKNEIYYPFQTMIFMRDIVSGMERQGYEPSPAFEAFKALTRSAKTVGGVVSGDKEEVTRGDIKNIVNTVGYFTALPTRQTWQTLEYFHDWMTGDEQPANAFEGAWRALVTGKPKE